MMGTKREYYEILGVPKGSGIDAVKKAYRQLALKYHPDRVPSDQKKDAEEKFKEISEAYAVLSDAQKKKLYDQYGHAGIDSRYTTEDIFKSADFSSIFGGSSGFGDIFEQLFGGSGADIFGGGGRSGSRTRSVGEDLQMQVAITLEEVCTGVDKNITFFRQDDCSRCNGSGAEPGSSKISCSSCNGTGIVRSGLGFISFSQTCLACSGQGKIIKNRCKVCSGGGRLKVKKKLKVNIPKGVDKGSILRLRSEGNFGPDGRGDFYVYIDVTPHNTFVREGDNIRVKVIVSVIKAILGSDIEVPTLYGNVTMKVPPGTQPNTVFRLKNKGMTNLRTKRLGDELVEVEIEIPKKLSSRERRILEDWSTLRRER